MYVGQALRKLDKNGRSWDMELNTCDVRQLSTASQNGSTHCSSCDKLSSRIACTDEQPCKVLPGTYVVPECESGSGKSNFSSHSAKKGSLGS